MRISQATPQSRPQPRNSPASSSQQPLPLPEPEPSPGQLQAEQVRLWKARPYWRQHFASLDEALAHPLTGRVLQVCAAAALRARLRQRTTKP